MKKNESITRGVSLRKNTWACIDEYTGGRHGGRSQFIEEAVIEKLERFVNKPRKSRFEILKGIKKGA